MRLFDRRRDREEPLDADVARELEALDRALAGEAVEDEHSGLATLAEDLRSERPEPPPSLERELEELRERGFSRRRGRLARLPRPRRALLLPAAGLATLAVVAGSIVVAGPVLDRDSGGDVGETMVLPADPGAEPAPSPAIVDERAGDAGDDADALSAFDRNQDVSPAQRQRLAPGVDRRREDRSAAIVLRTDIDRAREVSGQVISIARGAGGIVVSSNLTEGKERSSAILQLQVPTRELNGLLERISGLATVRSMNEASLDITQPFVSARDALRDARAQRRGLLRALGNAETEAEAAALQERIDSARQRIARAEARFERIARQARMSDISVTVEGVPGGDDDGSWSLGDAASDALEVLRTTAGVLLVALAVLLPVALLALAAWAALAALRRRRRERALDR